MTRSTPIGRRAAAKAAAESADAAYWSAQQGVLPYMVTVEERPDRKYALYLRWWNASRDNWAKRSLTRELQRARPGGATALRDSNGVIIEAVKRWAIAQAFLQYQRLSGDAETPGPNDSAWTKPLTIGETWDVITNPDTGLYPADTPHRREVKRALDYAALVWGAATAWAAIGRADITTLMRRRLRALFDRAAANGTRANGLRATEITVMRILSVAAWLRDEGRIPVTAALPKPHWRDDLAAFWTQLAKESGIARPEQLPKPHQPRYTLEEVRKLLAAAERVDPRVALAMALGAEYRLGQVIRSWRTDLFLSPSEDAPHGTFTIHGAGQKEGEVVYLTAAQRAAVDRALAGFLAPLEQAYIDRGTDYPLCPGGDLTGVRGGIGDRTPRIGRGTLTERAATRGWLSKVWPRVEAAAKVKPMKGRGPYGVRRIHVDAALDENISRRGLMAAGGWSSPAVPETIYAERENRAGRKEAMQKRAKIRGEE